MQKPKQGPGSLTMLRDTLENFFHKDLPADLSLNNTFRKFKLRDERLRAELAGRFYGIVRSWRPIVSALGSEKFGTVDEVKTLVETWSAWKKIYAGNFGGHETGVTAKLKNYLRIRKIRESYPDWLDEFAAQALGEEKWTELAKALNETPQLFLRTNTLKTTRDALLAVLKKENIPAGPVDGFDDAIVLDSYQNVFGLQSYRDGLFDVQDLSSQQVAPFLDVRPGMRVADACAGSGGKTLHLAALMKNRGKIIAMDVSQRKLDELRVRCSRNGVDMVETKLADDKAIAEMAGTFDRLLLDVPCSGSGVLRRNPDIRWRLDPRQMDELAAKQRELLSRYTPLLKPSGLLVYATCSIFPSEGEEQVNALMKDGNWEKEEEKRIDPIAGDGFYFARLKKI